VRVCLKRAARRILIGELARLAKGQVADGAGVAAGLARGRRHNRDAVLRAQKDSKGLGQKDSAALLSEPFRRRERLRAVPGRFRIARIGRQVGHLVQISRQVIQLVEIKATRDVLVLPNAKHALAWPYAPGLRLTKTGNRCILVLGGIGNELCRKSNQQADNI
jgi:hypothetical protein